MNSPIWHRPKPSTAEATHQPLAIIALAPDMRTLTLIVICSILLLLNACQMLDEAERPYRIEPGTPIDLLQPLVIPADQVGVFVPGTPIGNRYRYEAACRLELRSLAPAARTVSADHMTITRVQREAQIFSSRSSALRPVRLFDSDGPHLLQFTTYPYLDTPRQPDIFRLVCAHLQDSASQPRHLTRAEISTVLAPVMRLN